MIIQVVLQCVRCITYKHKDRVLKKESSRKKEKCDEEDRVIWIGWLLKDFPILLDGRHSWVNGRQRRI